MKNSVCTLFEKNYHYGAAVLTNSLVKNGFKGDIYAGYRGSLPEWTRVAKPNPGLNWAGAETIQVSEDVQLHFLPMPTDAHFTNYKAHFMLELWDGPAKDNDAMFYFDPDIVFIAEWRYFQEWVKCGVAVCEDVNSPVYPNNPRRIGWRNYFVPLGHTMSVKEPIYCNAGFLGLDKKHRDFAELWKRMMDELAPMFGGLNRSNVSGLSIPDEMKGDFAPFGQPDQDVLNAAIEAYHGDISFAGQEGMSFKHGAALIPHALGKVKPWILKPIRQTIGGLPPRTVDKLYWQYASGPIKPHSGGEIRRMNTLIKIAALIGRFYRRK